MHLKVIFILNKYYHYYLDIKKLKNINIHIMNYKFEANEY